MDPERNSGGQPPDNGDVATAIDTVSNDAAVSSATPVADAVSVSEPPAPPVAKKKPRRTRPKAGTHPNNVRKLRQSAMMSKAELARRAGVSPLTIDRVEAGCPCRMDTKRKILEALGLSPSAARDVFPDLDLP